MNANSNCQIKYIAKTQEQLLEPMTPQGPLFHDLHPPQKILVTDLD